MVTYEAKIDPVSTSLKERKWRNSSYGWLSLLLVGLTPALAFAGEHQPFDPGWTDLPAISLPSVAASGKHLGYVCGDKVCVLELDGSTPGRAFSVPEGAQITNLLWANDRHLLVQTRYPIQSRLFSSGFQYEDRVLLLDLSTVTQSLLLPAHPNVSDITTLLPDNAGAIIAHVPAWSLRPAASNSRVQNWILANTRLYRVDLDSGQHARIDLPTEGVYQAFTSNDGVAQAWLEANAGLGRYRLASAEAVQLEGEDFLIDAPRIFAQVPESPELLLGFDSGPLQGLQRIDLKSGRIERLKLDDVRHDDAQPIVDPWRHTLVGLVDRADGLARSVFSDDILRSGSERIEPMLRQRLGAGQLRLMSWSKDRTVMAGSFQRLGRPPEYFIFLPKTSELKLLGNPYPYTPPKMFASVEELQIPRADGSFLQAFLTRADSAKKPADAQPLPLLVLPHGGLDEWVDAGFDVYQQAWARTGAAVLQVSVRGARGRGYAHRDDGFGGYASGMADDLLLAARYAIDAGFGDQNAVCTAGFGYGGHTALLAAINAPDTVRCVIAIGAMTDPLEHVRSFSVDGYRLTEGRMRRVVGIHNLPVAQTSSLSLPRRAGAVESSVLLIHAQGDPVILSTQSRRLHRQLSRRGRSQLIELDGTGIDVSEYNRRRVLIESTAFICAQLRPSTCDSPRVGTRP
ncbi:MAG: prolyl oligopeptidase family serine peptidase [Gammaproteobacteria bacterium]|nr:prolyl oligopeptidase family serine peptidase [Gammaproteobacteria bacterium]